MTSEHEYKRMCWASRRGMLELDLILVPFVENKFRELSDADQRCYLLLMESEDNDLFSWLIGRKSPDDSALTAIVDQIIAYNGTAKL